MPKRKVRNFEADLTHVLSDQKTWPAVVTELEFMSWNLQGVTEKPQDSPIGQSVLYSKH